MKSNTVAGVTGTTVQGHWRELDVLRGIAAVMMVVNHAGVNFLSSQYSETGLTSTVLFIGSFAPVMFFFVTGVGSGIQSNQQKRSNRWASVFNKVGILVLADLLMAWSTGRWWGLDFLGFIGLITLVLELVRNSRTPITLSAIGIVLISTLRFLLGPVIHKLGYDQLWGLSFIFGTESIPGISYLLAPWLAYPFLGYVMGVAVARFRTPIEKQRLRVILALLAASILPAAVSAYLALKGAVFFRWGTVSLAFYVISFTVILVCFALALTLCSTHRLDSIVQALSLKGISSLAVVPIHYFLIDIGMIFGLRELQPIAFYPLAVAVLVLSFLLASFVERMGSAIRKMSQKELLRNSFIGVFVASACVAIAASHANPSLAMVARTIGQLVLCLLFVLPPKVFLLEKAKL